MNSRMEAVITRRREVIGRLKQVLIRSLDLELEPDEIAEDAQLFGLGLGLDSVDALQLVVGIEDEYNCCIPSDNISIYYSVNTLADFLLAQRENKSDDV